MSSRICVASIATPSLKELADMTMPNKIEYCERHGYSHGKGRANPRHAFDDEIFFAESFFSDRMKIV